MKIISEPPFKAWKRGWGKMKSTSKSNIMDGIEDMASGVWSAIKGDRGIKRNVLGRKKRMMEQSDYCWGSGA